MSGSRDTGECKSDQRSCFNHNMTRSTAFDPRGIEAREASSNNRRRMSLDDIKSSKERAGMMIDKHDGEARGLNRHRSESCVKLKHMNTLMISSFSPSQDSYRVKPMHGLVNGNPTEYLLIFDDIQTAKTWHIRRRYSDFHRLNQTIWALFGLPNEKNSRSELNLQHHCVRCLSALQSILFPLQQRFPRKNWFHSKNHRIIKKRSQYFRNYLLTWLAVMTGRKIYWDQLRVSSCDDFAIMNVLQLTCMPQPYGLCSKVISALKPILFRFLTTRAMRYDCISGEGDGPVKFNVPSMLCELKCARRRSTLEPIDEKHSFFYTSDTDSEHEEEGTMEYTIASNRDNQAV